MNGRPWTRAEIDDLFRTITSGGNTLALSVKLGRTHDALIAKAKRLNLAYVPAPSGPAASNVVTLVLTSPSPALEARDASSIRALRP